MTPQALTELQRAERRVRLLEAANLVGKQVTSILDLDQLLPQTVDIICDSYGFYYAGVFLLDESGRFAVLRAGRGDPGKAMIDAGHRLEVGSHSMIGWATGQRQARIALDVDEDAEHFKNPYMPLTRSEMALPLVVGDKVLGAVTVQSTEEHAFSDEDILTLQTMADQLAIAINNAGLLKELQRANEQLLRAKTYEALTAATTQAIHWIGNKALPMTTAVERIRADVASSKKIDEEDLDLLAESARLIVEVKENLLGPIREPQTRPVMAADLVRAAAFQVGLPEALVKIEVEENTPHIQADSAQMVRALYNIMKNSMEAHAKRIYVHIAPTADNRVSIEIADDGDGMLNEMKEKVWAAFVSTKENHTGLGLPATLLVVNQHHGAIAINSVPQKGTVVEIWLPAAFNPESALLSSAPKNILLIDDDDLWAAFAQQTLSAVGHHVTRATTVQPADLVLVDETLFSAQMDDVLAQLKANNLQGQSIVLSAAPSVDAVNRFSQSGIHHLALKPYTASELTALA
jgi:signal transduction histidine kinase